MTVFEVNGIKCGVAICYDAFFEEFIRMYMKTGALFYYRENGPLKDFQ